LEDFSDESFDEDNSAGVDTVMTDIHDHPLRFYVELVGYICDLCGEDLQNSYRCTMCDFDLCSECYTKLEQQVQKLGNTGKYYCGEKLGT
jgi:hypothetical protein